MNEEQFEMWFDKYLWDIYRFTVNAKAQMNGNYGLKKSYPRLSVREKAILSFNLVIPKNLSNY